MAHTDSMIVRCGNCGAQNRVPPDKSGKSAKCGRCGSPINTRSDAELIYTLRCTQCRAKNRVAAGKRDAGAVCGKCRTPLPMAELSAPQPMMITDANFDEKVGRSPLPVLLYAWSPS